MHIAAARRDGAVRPWLIGAGGALLAGGGLLAATSDAERARILAVNLVAVGVPLSVAGLVDLPGRLARAVPDARRRILLIAALALLAAVWAPYVLNEQSVSIGGARYWFLGDDAMISMRYARNLVEGHGLVWNPGERVEGYSNPLWMLTMAGVHLTGLSDARTSLAMLALAFALAAATVPLLMRLVALLGGGTAATTATLAAWVLNRNATFWGTNGFETTLQSALVLLAVCRMIEEHRAGVSRLSTYLAIGLLALVRGDGIALAAPLWAGAVLAARDRRRALAYAAVGLSLPIAGQVFRLAYYGEWLPNTAVLKTTGWDGRYAAGARYVVRFLLFYIVPLVAAVASVVRSGSAAGRALLALIGVNAAYVAFIGGDAFADFRFMVPVVPLLLALAFTSVECAIGDAPVRAGAMVLVLIATPLIVPDYGRVFAAPHRGEDESVLIGLLLRENSSPESSVADSAAGSVFYFSRRYGIDLLGKTDPRIAHLEARPGEDRPGHNKYDYAYSLGERRPDVLVAAFRVERRPGGPPAVSSVGGAWGAALLRDPEFQRSYLPNQVAVDTGRSIFVAEWSPERERISEWRQPVRP